MINIAILGAGAIARTHAEAFSDHPEYCKIVAVCNRHTDKAEKVIAEKGLDAKAYESLDAAMADVRIDAVSICLPPAVHAETAIMAAEKGLHVLVEKPMANSLAECDAMIEAAERNNVLLSSVCQLRFTTKADRVHRLINDGTFGRLLYASGSSFWWRGENYHDLSWRGTWAKEGGGVLTIQAIHHLDLMQYMLGMPQRITAVIGNVGHGNSECEDVATAILEYPDKFAQFSASQVAHGENHLLSFYTERVKLSIPWSPAACRAMPNGFPEADPEELEKIEAAYDAIAPLKWENHSGQVLNFLRAITGEEALVADGYEGRKVIELISAIYESACFRRSVTLPLEKSDPFYTAEGKVENMPHFHEKKVSVDAMAEGKITFA